MKNVSGSGCEVKELPRTERTTEHPSKGSKKSISLTDVPLELRRAEASKPLYLTRYE